VPDQVFEHDISFITTRIEIEQPNGAGTSVGTGFFYRAELGDGSGRSIILLISNRHVFLDPAGTLRISLNGMGDEGALAYGSVRSFQQTNFSAGYFAHPDSDVDLACVNVSPVTHERVFLRTLSDAFLDPIDYDRILPGQTVLFVGYPDNRYDVVHNLPLVRAGSIASLPSVDFNGRGQIVIDAQVFQGSSGSPLFVSYDNRYRLLGVITATMIRHSMLQTIPSNISGLSVQQILGLGIVIKQRHVKELIDHAIQQFIDQNPAS
jgi:hypothetical protein